MAPVQDSVLAGLGALLGMGALFMTQSVLPLLPTVHEMLPGDLKSQCPPLGAVAVLLFCMPGAPASSTRAVVLGHIVGSLAALTCVMGLPGPYAPGLAVGLAVTGMKLFDCVHPPAAAYAFLFAANGWGPKQVLAPGLLGAVILVVVQRVWTQLTAAVVKPKTA